MLILNTSDRRRCSTANGFKGGAVEEEYLDGQIFVNFHCLAEDIDILHQIGQLPCIPKLVKHARLWCGL